MSLYHSDHKIMFEKNIHIDLTLPRSWNQCTTEQLETIAACIMKHTAMADRYHPFDWQNVKAELFFLLTEVEIIHIETAENDPDDTTYLCRLTRKDSRSISGGSPIPSRRAVLCRPWFHHGSKLPEFRLRPWQVQSWIDTQLKWLDDEKSTLLLFPYKQLIRTRHFTRHWPFLKKTCHAPSELLQDFTWQQYRHLQDYMDLYIRQQNRMVKISQSAHDAQQLIEVRQQMTDTRNLFLAILFGGGEAGASSSDRVRSDAPNIAKQISHITEVQWQVILLWWSGFMHYLKEHYPRCFKSSGKKNPKRPPNPLELYTSIIATMQKYIGIDEEKVNHQTFHIILEQLERIAKENEEIEKMNRKHK